MAHTFNSQLDAFSLYHIDEESTSSSIAHSASRVSPALPALGHAIAGSTGTAISNLVTYPLDLIITRLQIQRLNGTRRKDYTDPTTDHYDGLLDAAQKIYDRDGIAGFFAGVGPDTAKSVLDSFLFFLFYNYMRTNRVTRRKAEGHGGTLPAWDELSIGAMSGGLAKLFTTPLSNITTRAQTARGNPSIRSIADSIQREKGLVGFWSGYSASLVLTLNPSLTFFFYEALKGLLPKTRREDPGARLTFLIAALSKAMASSITYPFSLAKARAQASSAPPVQRTAAQIKEDAKTESSAAFHSVSGARSAAHREGRKAADATVLSSILRIAQEEGISALYVGLGGEVLKGFFSHGITMLVKEQVHGWVIRLYFYLSESYRKTNPIGQAQDAAENIKGQASDAYDRLSGQAQSQTEILTAQAQSAGQTLSEKASDAVENVKQTATEAYQKAADTASNITNHGTLSAPKGVVEPTYGAIPIPPRSHTSGSAQPAPGAKARSVYNSAVGTDSEVQTGGQVKSVAAGRTHSVYDQATRETRNQDTIIDLKDMAAASGQREFPKGSEKKGSGN